MLFATRDVSTKRTYGLVSPLYYKLIHTFSLCHLTSSQETKIMFRLSETLPLIEGSEKGPK